MMLLIISKINVTLVKVCPKFTKNFTNHLNEFATNSLEYKFSEFIIFLNDQHRYRQKNSQGINQIKIVTWH